MWAKNWLLGRDRFTHLNLFNFIRNDSPEDYKHYFRMSDVLAKVNPLIVKQDTAMRNAITPEVRIATGRSFEDLKFAVRIRETGSGPPTHVRAKSEPSTTEDPGEPSWTRPSPARGAPHTDEFGSLEPEPSQTLTCMGTLTEMSTRILPGVKGGRRVRLTTSPLSVS
jgi:hypothetical protein